MVQYHWLTCCTEMGLLVAEELMTSPDMSTMLQKSLDRSCKKSNREGIGNQLQLRPNVKL